MGEMERTKVRQPANKNNATRNNRIGTAKASANLIGGVSGPVINALRSASQKITQNQRIAPNSRSKCLLVMY